MTNVANVSTAVAVCVSETVAVSVSATVICICIPCLMRFAASIAIEMATGVSIEFSGN